MCRGERTIGAGEIRVQADGAPVVFDGLSEALGSLATEIPATLEEGIVLEAELVLSGTSQTSTSDSTH